jgi:hypothetical protein
VAVVCEKAVSNWPCVLAAFIPSIRYLVIGIWQRHVKRAFATEKAAGFWSAALIDLALRKQSKTQAEIAAEKQLAISSWQLAFVSQLRSSI